MKKPSEPSESGAIFGIETAPLVYFEAVSSFGLGPNVARVVLETMVLEPSETATPPITHRRVVAHLSGSMGAFLALREAINRMEAALTPPTNVTPN